MHMKLMLLCPNAKSLASYNLFSCMTQSSEITNNAHNRAKGI